MRRGKDGKGERGGIRMVRERREKDGMGEIGGIRMVREKGGGGRIRMEREEKAR